MKKSNLISMLITTITSLFITGFAFAQSDGHSLDAADGSPTDAVYVDNNGRVGIGTTIPGTTLHINSGDLNTASIFESEDAIVLLKMKDITTTGSGYAIARTGDNLTFFTSDSSRMIIDSDGNVGIGTINPETNLNVESSDAKTYQLILKRTASTEKSYLGNYGNSLYLSTGAYFDGVWNRDDTGTVPAMIQLNGNDGSIVFRNNHSSNAPVEKMRIDSSGNVGIGTTNPQSTLDLGTGTHGRSIVWGGSTGQHWYNSIGSAYSSADLIIGQGVKLNSSVDQLHFAYDGSYGVSGIRFDRSTGNINFLSSSRSARTKDDVFTENPRLIIGGNGNVGIGTTNLDNYKLNVVGSVRANEIVVNTTGADYVFEDGYNLRSLEEVAEYIEKEKHLPEIPSAQEMQENGVGVSEMQTKLLAKVEELTLYVIEQNKKLENQNNEIIALKKELTEMQKNMN